MLPANYFSSWVDQCKAWQPCNCIAYSAELLNLGCGYVLLLIFSDRKPQKSGKKKKLPLSNIFRKASGKLPLSPRSTSICEGKLFGHPLDEICDPDIPTPLMVNSLYSHLNCCLWKLRYADRKSAKGMGVQLPFCGKHLVTIIF